MYNIHSHYETLFYALKNIVTHRRLIYLYPYGSTQPENIERSADDISKFGDFVKDGPMFIFYDQEPIYGNYNYTLFDYIKDNFQPPHILVTTEKDNPTLNEIHKKYGWPIVYYFHHVFAAHDWFRGYQYNLAITNPKDRTIRKKYITFNRLTGNARVYRSFFIAELQKNKLLEQGHVSYSDVCPEHGYYEENVLASITTHNVATEYALNARYHLDQIDFPLRIDQKHNQFIENDSMRINAIEECMESFLYVVTETCYWDTKKHLTEKIFKPIVTKQPFLLLACAHNLEYLRSYGFKTFGAWWDESYDTIEDPIQRLQAVVAIIKHVCSKSNDELEAILLDMQEVLDYNYNWFYNKQFLDQCWNELTINLQQAAAQLLPPTSQETLSQHHPGNVHCSTHD